MIVVVSDVLKESLIARKVDPKKILVNPNGADPDAYAPASAGVRAAVRAELHDLLRTLGLPTILVTHDGTVAGDELLATLAGEAAVVPVEEGGGGD